MFFDLKETFHPWLQMIKEFLRTFSPYNQSLDPLDLIRYNPDGQEFQKLLDETMAGELLQVPRGAFNLGKGLCFCIASLVFVIPPFSIMAAIVYYLKSNCDIGNTSVFQACIGLICDLCRLFISGLGLCLHGVLQITTSPFAYLIRIPLRLAITAWEKKKQAEQQQHNQAEAERVLNEHHPADNAPNDPTHFAFQPADNTQPVYENNINANNGLYPFNL